VGVDSFLEVAFFVSAPLRFAEGVQERKAKQEIIIAAIKIVLIFRTDFPFPFHQAIL
jgi:hypothetical protein